MLTHSCGEAEDWESGEILPPHRWERTFSFNFRRRWLRPDATCEISYRGDRTSYLVEYEQRANRPSRMEEKVERYRNYFGAVETRGDFDRQRPVALMILPDSATASRFLLLARKRTAHPLPMLVSSMDVLLQRGPIEKVWRSPWHLRLGEINLFGAT